MNFGRFIRDSLQEAAKVANDNFGRVSSVTKVGDNNQVLTETDVSIGKLLIHRIQEIFPGHNIIDEEAGVIDKNSLYTWVIDPIDGTSNFAQGIPLYGNMLGLLEADIPIAGGIAMPYFNEIYVAEKGQGTYCNDVRIQATNETNLLSTLIAYTIDGHQENPEYTRKEAKLIGEIVLEIRNLRDSGSCFDVVMVAKGKYGGYVNQTSKIWDNVAAQILLEEAGCIYTDLLGKKIDYSNPLMKAKDNFTFCTAPAVLHKQLQSIIQRHY